MDEKAAETFSSFAERYRRGFAGTYSVKIPLSQNGKTEHIWVQVDTITIDKITGRLANEPVVATRYKMGQSLKFTPKIVEDWMIRTSEGIMGGYTARVAIAAMPEDQARKMRAMFID